MASGATTPVITDVPQPPSFAAEGARVLVPAMGVGLLGGGAGLLFRQAADQLPPLVWGAGGDLVDAVARAAWWWKLIVPAAGGLLAALLLQVGSRFTRQERGWDLLEAVVLRDGVLHAGPAATRALSSLATVASGGAVGREGPIVLLAATVASLAGRALRVTPRQLRILAGCGVAAGMAAAYNTPVGAALFTMEVIFGSFALEVFSPLVIASVVATVLTRSVYGNEPVFDVPALALGRPLELVACGVLGLLAGGVSAGFLQALRSSAAFFRRHARVPRPVAMALVGLLLGVALLGYPELVGNGREAIEHLFRQRIGIGHALALLALRLVLTPLTVGSGAVGGVFTPTLFVGAMLGNAVGILMLPAGADPRAFALVGMGALLAGTTHAPLTSVLMVFEMTLDYHVVVPLLLACAVSALTATAVSRDSVYTEALRRKTGVEQPRLLRLLTVRDVMRQEQATVTADMPLKALLERLVATRRNHVYVVEPAGRFVGAVSLHDVNQALVQGAESRLTSGDVLRRTFEATYPDEPLQRALDRFAAQPTERLPVLDDPVSRRLVGTVSRRDILGVLSLDLMQRPAAVVDLAAAQDDEVAEIDVPADCIGRAVADCDLAARHDVALLTVRRNGKWMLPEPKTALEEGDRLLVTGDAAALARLSAGANLTA